MVFSSVARLKTIDWNKVKAILAKEDFAAVNEQRGRHLELTRVLATPVPKLDLSHYKNVLENQALVSEIESSLNSFKPTRADVNPILKSLQEQKVSALKNAKKTVEEVNKTVSGFKSDLESIRNIQNPELIQAEHVYEASPGLQKVYFDRLKDGKVYHDDHNFGEKMMG